MAELVAKASSLNKSGGDPVRINVGCWATIFQISEALSSDVAGDTDGCTTVGNTRGERPDMASLVPSGQPHLVILTIDGNVLHVLLRELLDGILDGLHSSRLTHGLGGVVGVASSTVPFTRKRLGMERDFDAPFFGNTDEQEAGHPKVVAHGDTLARADLELPLRRHNLRVDSRDVYAGVHARSIVGLDEVTCKYFSCADTAIVWALRTRETALWPLVWFVIGIEESVLLLKTEPWLDLKNLVHDLLGVVAVVGLVGGSVVVVGLGKDEDVVATTERILEDGGGAKVDVRVAAGCLVCRGAVEIPNTEITNVLDGLRDGHCLATKTTISVDPDIFGLDLVTLIEFKITFEEVGLV